MQKEEKIMVVLLVMAVLSLIIGYFGFIPQVSAYSAYSADSKVGDRIYVDGTILSRQMTAKGDNLILSISNLNIKVFISKDNGAKEVYEKLKTGDKVRINGKVAEYKNSREIVVESASDIEKL